MQKISFRLSDSIGGTRLIIEYEDNIETLPTLLESHAGYLPHVGISFNGSKAFIFEHGRFLFEINADNFQRVTVDAGLTFASSVKDAYNLISNLLSV